MKTIMLATGLALAALGSQADAASYTINATSCVLDPVSVPKAFGTAGTISHNTGQTGNIALYCPIPSNLGFTPAFGYMTYSATANAPSNFVAFALVRMAFTTGALSSGPATFNTSSSGAVVTQSASLGLTWDPNTYAYWVRIDISRTTTAPVQKLYAIRLTN